MMRAASVIEQRSLAYSRDQHRSLKDKHVLLFSFFLLTALDATQNVRTYAFLICYGKTNENEDFSIVFRMTYILVPTWVQCHIMCVLRHELFQNT